MKSEVECIGGRQDVLGFQKILWIRIIITVNHKPLTVECSNVTFSDSDTTTSIRKDIQGSLFILLVFEPA